MLTIQYAECGENILHFFSRFFKEISYKILRHYIVKFISTANYIKQY